MKTAQIKAHPAAEIFPMLDSKEERPKVLQYVPADRRPAQPDQIAEPVAKTPKTPALI